MADQLTNSESRPNTGAHITSQSQLSPTIKAWRIYLDDQANSINTIKAFTADLRLLAHYLPPDRTLGSITTADLNAFLEWMQHGRGVPCSPKTLSRRITSLKAFFRWLHENAVILIDPAEKVVQKSVVSPLPVVLTPDETEAVLAVAEGFRQANPPDARYAALFVLLINTGLKKSECLGLRLNHIDLEAPKGPQLFVRYTNPRYRYKERKIQLPETWIPIFHEYRAQYESDDRVFPWSPRRLEYLLEDLSAAAGLEKHISFEMCRWTCALIDWRAGMDRLAIRQKLGISKIQWREVSAKLGRLADQTPT